jgi:hypothetical protein
MWRTSDRKIIEEVKLDQAQTFSYSDSSLAPPMISRRSSWLARVRTWVVLGDRHPEPVKRRTDTVL